MKTSKRHTNVFTLIFFILVFISFKSSAQTTSPPPVLRKVFPHIGLNEMDIAWDDIGPTAEEYAFRRKENNGNYSAWISVAKNTTYTDVNLSPSSTYTYQVIVKEGGLWGNPLNEKSNSFQRIWPVRNGTTEAINLLHGFAQPIEVGGKKYFHEGIDINGVSNVSNELVVAPIGGILKFAGQGDPGNIASYNVNLEVSINGSIYYIQFNHLKDIPNSLLVQAQYSTETSVEAGEVLGKILDPAPSPAFTNTLSSHTHCHFWTDYYKPLESSLDPFNIWDKNIYRDPLGKAPEVMNTNDDDGDSDSDGDDNPLRFRKASNSNDYFVDSDPKNVKVYTGVDILVEAVDKQSDVLLQVPRVVGYHIQHKVSNKWQNAVKSSSSPYVLTDNNQYSNINTLNNNINKILDLDDKLKSVKPNPTPNDYIWNQWFTYIVTNTKGTDGAITNLDDDQCWATDARVTASEDNGYKPGYDRARAIDEAKFPDGRYKINIRLQDFINTPPDYEKEIFVDNFRPYAKNVEIKSGKLNYLGTWNWNPNTGVLKLASNSNNENACGRVSIKITTSEPMKNVSIEVPSLSFSAKSNKPVINTDATEWEFEIPSDMTANASSGPHIIVIDGLDSSDNVLQGFTSKNDVSGASLQKRQIDGTWIPLVTPVKDNIHTFELSNTNGKVTVETTDKSSCSAGKAVLSVSGSIGNFVYSIDGGKTFQTSNTFPNLSVSNNYNAIAKDQNGGCEFSENFSIKESINSLKVAISGYSSPVPVCNNNPTSLTLNASATGGSGNYNYSWPGGSTIVTASGDVSVTATDKETGCTGSATANVVFVPILCSRDPNDIIGPDGYGQGKMVAKSKSQSYMIRFENDPDFATAPAQVVKINHPLDPNVNLFSLRLGDFGFGGLTFTVPQDKTFYATRLNLVDSLGVVVDVTAGIDAVKKEAFWIFESKDPKTGLPPTNASLGFLPVNDSSTKGEGFVTYTVKAAANTQTGDSIHAKASIVFDINAPIETPVIFNTIDAVAPVSKVNVLSQTSKSTTVNVSWSGRDDMGGSGIKEYDLYVADSGSAYSIYQKGITDTVATFTGSVGTTYNFFTIATDNVGNREEMKNMPDATVSITAACPTLTYYPDLDGDGYGSSAGGITAVTCDSVPIGFVLNNTDCNDNDPAIHPGASEVCNGKDDNCDGRIDEGMILTTYYQDMDGDGYGDASRTLQACTQPYGYVLNSADCNDNDNTIYPGATEICDGKDNDCNGQVDEELVLQTYYRDADRDGYGTSDETISSCSATVPFGYSLRPGDCDDHDILVYPGAPENCDGKDNDCNGIIDDGFTFTLYRDEDGDGFGDPKNTIQACKPQAGYVIFGGDCDDKNPLVHIFAAEICGNGIDDNCDGRIDEGCAVNPAVRQAAGTLKSVVKEVQKLNARAIPNPSYTYFTLNVSSSSLLPVTVRITDASGRLIELKTGVTSNGTVLIGQNYGVGLYFAEIVQGNEKTLIKLIKIK